MSTTHIRTAHVLPLLLGALCIACGNHQPTTPMPSAGMSASGAGGASGHGASGNKANGGSGGASGAAAGSPAPAIICGSMTCSAPPAGLSALAGGLPIQGIPVPIACCVDGANGSECGTAPSPTGACEPRAAADDRCASIDPGALSAFSGGIIAGCCTPNGACGVDGALFGRGCIENSEAAAQLSMIPVLGTAIKVPAAQPCDPNAGVSEDAGI